MPSENKGGMVIAEVKFYVLLIHSQLVVKHVLILRNRDLVPLLKHCLDIISVVQEVRLNDSRVKLTFGTRTITKQP